MIVKKANDVAAEEVTAGEGTSRQILLSADEGPNFAMRRFHMQPGGGMPNHTNTVEHEQYVLAGRATVGIGHEVITVQKDDVVFIPANVPHWYRAEGDEAFEFLCMVPNLPDETKIVAADEG